jgi:hypothetical protein
MILVDTDGQRPAVLAPFLGRVRSAQSLFFLLHPFEVGFCPGAASLGRRIRIGNEFSRHRFLYEERSFAGIRCYRVDADREIEDGA